MAWDSVQFRDREGKPVAQKTRNILLGLIEKALRTPDADPDLLISAASSVCANMTDIKDFAAYANRSIFRVTRRAYVTERKAQARLQSLPDQGRHLEDETVLAEVVEQQILIEELLSGLNPIDREIYRRRLDGQSFPHIDRTLRLKPRTSEYRFREAQARVRKTISARPPR